MRGTIGGIVDERNNWRNSGWEEQLEEQWMGGTIGGIVDERNNWRNSG